MEDPSVIEGTIANVDANLLKRGPKADPVPEEEYEELPPPVLVPRGAPKGCLTVHLKNCKDFNKSSSIKKGTQGFLRISIGGKVKCTMLQPYKDSRAKFPLCFNEWKYFSIQIPKNIDNTLGICESSRLVVELIFFEQETGVPKLIGKATIKLLDILNKPTVTHQMDLRLKRQIICKLDMEMVVAYGSLGYGYSHQLRHPKKDMQCVVERSLFLRCPPPDDRKDPLYNVTTPRPVPYPDFIASLVARESTDPASRACHQSSGLSPVVLEHLQKRGRLLQMYETMEAYESPEDAIQFLEKQVMKKGLRTGYPWRMTRKSKVLSKWRKKATMVSKLLHFGSCSESAKQKAQSMPSVSALPSDTTPPAPTTPQKSAPPSTAAPMPHSNPHPAQSKAPTPPRHKALVLPESSPAASQPTISQTPKPATVASVPIHGTSPRFLTVLEEDREGEETEEEEEEKKEEEKEKQRVVNSPVSSLLRRLSSLTLTPELTLTPTPELTPVPTRQHSQEECQHSHPRDQFDTAEPRQETVTKRTSLRHLGGSGPGEIRDLGWNQGETAGTCSTGGGQEASDFGSVSSGGQRENGAHCSTVLSAQSSPLPSPVTEVAPQRVLGAWTENRATEQSPVGGLDWRSGGLPAGLRPGPTLRQLLSPPTTPPSSPMSPSPLARSPLPLPPLSSRATPSPDLETLTLDTPLRDRTCESNPPPLTLGESSSRTSRLGQGPGASRAGTDPLSSWLGNDSLAAGGGSGQWSLLSEIDITPLRSGLVFSPLTPISTSPTSPTCTSPGRTRVSKPGKERPRIVESLHAPYPYHRPSRDRDYSGKM